MPKYPNTIKWKQIEYVAKKLDWVLRDHDGGSHRHYKKEGAGVLTIPVYKEISVNKGHLFPSILRTMKISKKSFFRCLNS